MYESGQRVAANGRRAVQGHQKACDMDFALPCAKVKQQTLKKNGFLWRTSLDRVKTIRRRVTDVRTSATDIRTEAKALREEIKASLTKIDDALNRVAAPSTRKSFHFAVGVI